MPTASALISAATTGLAAKHSHASAASSTTTGSTGLAAGLRQIGRLAETVQLRLGTAMQDISDINLQTRLLSFNAQLEATHAGAAGRAFDVVAKEMVELSARTSRAATSLDQETRGDINRMITMTSRIAEDVRGVRLSDLAFTNIDLVDRNLYERTCDVRWWATDSSCVEAAVDHRHCEHASRRLGVILDSYTVYYDIVLCDTAGRVIANGRPGSYDCIGENVGKTAWFQAAMATTSGSEYGFQGPHESATLAGGKKVIIYSAAVRRDGRENGEIIGCLGIVFNWEALAQSIVLGTQVGAAELPHTRVCLVDATGMVIADNRERHLRSRVPLEKLRELMANPKGFTVITLDDAEPQLIAYAKSPGFETYATGWHSFIFQKLKIDEPVRA